MPDGWRTPACVAPASELEVGSGHNGIRTLPELDARAAPPTGGASFPGARAVDGGARAEDAPRRRFAVGGPPGTPSGGTCRPGGDSNPDCAGLRGTGSEHWVWP
eukprot:5119136-Alexandrium_andersonii.AAC.1